MNIYHSPFLSVTPTHGGVAGILDEEDESFVNEQLSSGNCVQAANIPSFLLNTSHIRTQTHKGRESQTSPLVFIFYLLL